MRSDSIDATLVAVQINKTESVSDQECTETDILASARKEAAKLNDQIGHKLVFSPPPVNEVFIVDNWYIPIKEFRILFNLRRKLTKHAQMYLGNIDSEWTNDLNTAICEILTNSAKYSKAANVQLKIAFWPGGDSRCIMYYIIEDDGAGISQEELKEYVHPYSSSLPCCSETNLPQCSMGLGFLVAASLCDALYMYCTPEGGLTVTIEKSISSSYPRKDYNQYTLV